MEVLGIGPLELLFIFLIALLVMGPEEMQQAARTMGRWLRRVMTSPYWRSFTHTMREVRYLPNRLAREAGLEESLREVEEGIESATAVLHQAILPPEVEADLKRELQRKMPLGGVPYGPRSTPRPAPSGEVVGEKVTRTAAPEPEVADEAPADSKAAVQGPPSDEADEAALQNGKPPTPPVADEA